MSISAYRDVESGPTETTSLSPALVHQKTLEVSITSPKIPDLPPFRNNKEISKDVIKNVCEFEIATLNPRERRAFEKINVNSSPTYKRCKFILETIFKDSTIFIVPNELQLNSRTQVVACTLRRQIDLNSDEAITIIGKDALARLRSNQQDKIPILTIAQAAFKALQDYSEAIKHDRYWKSYCCCILCYVVSVPAVLGIVFGTDII